MSGKCQPSAYYCRHLCLPLVVLLLLTGQPSASATEGEGGLAPPAEEVNATPFESATGEGPEPESWLDRLQVGFAENVDGAARWVDGFFGEQRTSSSGRGAYGRVTVRPIWKEYEGTRVQVRFRAHLPLDNIKRRTYAIIGRGDVDQMIENDNSDKGLFETDRENDWLVGLGYKPGWSSSGRVSLGGGVKLNWPPDPYVRVSYNWKHDFTSRSLVRLRETVFWQESEDFGASTSLDLEHRIGKNSLLRWANWVKISGATQDFIYDSRIMLYKRFSYNRAIMYAIGMRGETGAEEPVREYGGYVIYRQRAWRDWLFAELILGATHYKEDDWAERKWALLLGIGFEMAFEKSRTQGPPSQGGSHRF